MIKFRNLLVVFCVLAGLLSAPGLQAQKAKHDAAWYQKRGYVKGKSGAWYKRDAAWYQKRGYVKGKSGAWYKRDAAWYQKNGYVKNKKGAWYKKAHK